LKREFLTTADGSITIHLPEWNEQYHSKNGAIAEAVHVFIQAGLRFWLDQNSSAEVSILEIGLGTGLNALLTFNEAVRSDLSIYYTGYEAYPLSLAELKELNYCSLLEVSDMDFHKIHESPWEFPSAINSNFSITKRKKFFSEIDEINVYDLVYFDAFGARVQPELWTEEIFLSMFKALKTGGVLVTYSAKGSVRRALQQVGFVVERLAGPPGKREMLRASKRG
jgi:tRNA U34 5-methylaminomethyl-2-thiouridine-forming methyltransferase MnmC